MKKKQEEQRCRVCGCTWYAPCITKDGPCYWVKEDLCSACATEETKETDLAQGNRMGMGEFSLSPSLQKGGKCILSDPAGMSFQMVVAIRMPLEKGERIVLDSQGEMKRSPGKVEMK
jgi:hypothetical protein